MEACFICKFGFQERIIRSISTGLNKKRGMDDDKFKKYVKNDILPLYPDACDMKGKCVMIKVDSRPGRVNVELLAELQLIGLYLYPGLPNTTAVTQETDQDYGPSLMSV